MSKDIKFKVHCKIIDYIEQNDPELAQIIRGVCADGALSSLKGKPGITFLMPTDKAFRKKLLDLSTSDDYNKVDMANDMINALIIRNVFKTPADWMAHRDDIPNSLYPYQHVEVDSVSGKEVVFKSGARAEVDDKFIDGSKKKQLAVWKLTSGEIPVTKDKPSTGKYSKKNGKGKTGGYTPSANLANSLRWKIKCDIEEDYVKNRSRKSQFSSSKRRDVLICATLSLIECAKSRGDQFIAERILPMLSFAPIDFYLLVEPHKVEGDFLIDDSLIDEWWGNCSKYEDYKGTYEYLCQLMQNSPVKADIYQRRDDVLRCIHDIAQQIINTKESKGKMIVENTNNCYKQLEQNNTIGNCTNVYPAPIASFYSTQPELKRTHDELRFVTHVEFSALDAVFDESRCKWVFNYIGESLNAGTADARRSVRMLLTPNLTKYIEPVDKINSIAAFILSTAFLYIPTHKDDVIKMKSTLTMPSPENPVYFNITGAHQEKLEAML